MKVEAEKYPNLKWEDEPIEVGLIELNATNEELLAQKEVLIHHKEEE